MQIKPTSEMTVRELTIAKLELQSAISRSERFAKSLESWEKKGLSWKAAIAPLKAKLATEIKEDKVDLRDIQQKLARKQKTLF